MDKKTGWVTPHEGVCDSGLEDRPDLQGPEGLQITTVVQIIPAPIEMTVVFALEDFSDCYTMTPTCLALLRVVPGDDTEWYDKEAWYEIVPVLNGGGEGLMIESEAHLLEDPLFVQIVMRGSEHVAAVFEGWRQKRIDDGLIVETEPGRYERT